VVEKTEVLKDGTKVTLRDLHLDDLDRLMKFFPGPPANDRKYLRVDVTKRHVVARLRRVETGDVPDRRPHDQHRRRRRPGTLGRAVEQASGEIRLIIARPFQHKGLGTIMVRELYFIAFQKKLETIIVRMMRPQVGAQHIFRKLGFREETLLPDYVKDIAGTTQDLVIMTCNIKDLWKELDHFLRDTDWQRRR
jgi:hypothetical protein